MTWGKRYSLIVTGNIKEKHSQIVPLKSHSTFEQHYDQTKGEAEEFVKLTGTLLASPPL